MTVCMTLQEFNLGARPSKYRKRESDVWGGVEVYTFEFYCWAYRVFCWTRHKYKRSILPKRSKSENGSRAVSNSPKANRKCASIPGAVYTDFLKVCFETNEGWGSQVDYFGKSSKSIWNTTSQTLLPLSHLDWIVCRCHITRALSLCFCLQFTFTGSYYF